MLVQVLLMSLAIALAQETSSETSSSDEPLEAPSRRCGGLGLSGPPVEDPFPRARTPLSTPFATYIPLLELDDLHPLPFHFGCSIGVPTPYGCAIQKRDRRYLIVGPLLEDNQPRVPPFETSTVYPIGLRSPHCPAGIPTYSGCMVEQINGSWLRIAKLPLQ